MTMTPAGASRAASRVSAGRVDTRTVPSGSARSHRSSTISVQSDARFRFRSCSSHKRDGARYRSSAASFRGLRTPFRRTVKSAKPQPLGHGHPRSSAPRRTLTTSTSWFDARWSAVVKVARTTPPTPEALMIRKRTRRRVAPDAGASSRVRRRPRASASFTARSSHAPAIGTATALAAPKARARSVAMPVTSSYANSRPPSRTSSSQARSRPIVVAGPCPGKTRRGPRARSGGRATRPSRPRRRRAGRPAPSRRRTGCRR